MERARRLLIIFLVGIIIWLFLMIQAASAAEIISAQLPNFSVGDCWVIKDEDGEKIKLEFLRQEGENSLFLINDGSQIIYKSPDFGNKKIIDVKTGRVLVFFKESVPLLKFPLFVGKKWDFAYEVTLNDGMRGMFSLSYQVDSFKKVVVQAGEFDTFEVVCQIRLNGIKNGIFVYKEDIFRYWYAPKVKYFIKTDDINSIELVEYKVK